MKNSKVFFGIVVTAMVVGLALSGCKQDASDDWWDNDSIYKNVGANVLKGQTLLITDAANSDGAITAATYKVKFDGSTYIAYEKGAGETAGEFVAVFQGKYTYNLTNLKVQAFSDNRRAKYYPTDGALWITGELTKIALAFGATDAATFATELTLDKLNATKDSNDLIGETSYEKAVVRYLKATGHEKQFLAYEFNVGAGDLTSVTEADVTAFLAGHGKGYASVADYIKDYYKGAGKYSISLSYNFGVNAGRTAATHLYY